MTDGPPRRLVLWGVGTSRTLRAHWALHELGLDYETKAILARSGETKTQEYTRLNPRQKIPLLQDGDFKIAESPAIAAYLSNTYGTPENALIPSDPREHATWLEWCFYAATELDATSLYVMRRHGPEARLWRSPCRAGKRRPLFRDAAASCRASAAGRTALPGRQAIYHCRHAAGHLPDLGGELPGAGYRGVSRLYGEDHLSAGLPCQRRRQHTEGGIVASAYRLLLRDTAGAREIPIQRQVS